MPEIDEWVVVLQELDTGIIRGVTATGITVALDAAAQEVEATESGVRKLTYKHRGVTGGFLLVAKAWVNPFTRRRHLRIQYHCIRPDGSVTGRVSRMYRVNGKTKFSF